MTNKFIEQRVDELEQEISELKVIVHQLRKPSTVVGEALTQTNEIIEFEGKQYKKVEREAREGDVVILRGDKLPGWFTKRMKYKVESNEQIMDSDGEMQCVYNPAADRTPETVDVYELIPSFGTNEGQDLESEYAEQVKQEVQHQTVPCSAAKSPNQLRAEIIEKAKGFVEEHLTSSEYGYGVVGNNTTPLTLSAGPIKYRFEVNADKRTIVAIGALYHTGFYSSGYRGIAKCNPSDVFNEHIGKAIALGRALGLDVSEFEGAVQPSEVVVGTDTHHFKNGEFSFSHTIVDEEDAKETNAEQNSCGWTFKIINDTNAIYGGVE